MEDGGRDPSRPISEEAAKKNTDCVYFLASPLTCKKGNECEYRHSEGARVNPRDCWFWLNGNCLNPKCSFRHPPLDGFSGAPVTTPSGSTLPSTQTAMPSPASHAPAAHTSSKQSIPCYYFQKGGCLKGERCPFMHDVPPSNSPSMQPTAKVNTEVTEPTSSLKSTSWVLENYAHHDIHKTSDKPVEVSRTSTKMNVKAETVLTSGISGKSSIMPSPLSNVTFHILPPPNVPSNTSAVSVRPEGHHLEPLNEHVQNGREADESLRESSPGFDVLVDDECEDTNYFHVDDRDPSSHEVDNPNVTNDFDYHSSVYNSMAQFEREPHRTHNEVSEYDRRGRHDRYRQDDCRYSGRNKDRLSIQEGRTSCREDCSNEIYGSDLRHQLLKKRKVNGLRSAINTDHHGEPYQKEKDDQYAEKQRYLSRNSGRDQHRFSHESSISKRLQGRITLTGEPPSDNPRNMHSEKERERGKDWARSSAGQPLNYQGRLHDRSITSMHEAGSLEGQLRRDEMGPLNFAGPKSLAEIKGTKFSNDTKDRLSKASNSTITHEQKSLILNKALGPHESEGSLSFEGPKPLSEILKRKREAAPGNDDTSSNGHGNNHNIIVEDHAGGSMVMPITDSQDVCLLESQNRGCPAASETEGPNSTAVEEEGPGMTDGEQLPQIDQSSAKKEVLEGEDRLADNIEDPENGAYDPRDGGFEYAIEEGTDFQKEDNEELSLLDQSSHKEEVLEPEDGMLVDNMEDSEDNYDQRDEEVEYDEVEDTDFRTYDENDQKDENDVDDEDDDDDDFARKIGVMFS